MRLIIGYFADGPWSHEALKLILADDSLKIAFVCVRYDSADEILKNLALQAGIPCLRHHNVNSDEFIAIAKGYECDIFVSMSFNQIMKSNFYNLPIKGTINCHAGKLPFYRGRNILNWALINDEKEFGITVHYIDDGIDTGDIILQRTYVIEDSDDYASLLCRAYGHCAEILYDAIKAVQSDKVKTIKQTDIHPIGFYCIQRKSGDEVLDWSQSSRDVFNFVRAICKPGPMARTFLKHQEMKINCVRLIEHAPVFKGVAGSILGVSAQGLIVKTADSFVLVSEYDYEGTVRVGDRLQ